MSYISLISNQLRHKVHVGVLDKVCMVRLGQTLVLCHILRVK